MDKLISGFTLLIWSSSALAAGQFSSSYSILWDVVDDGGGASSSTNYKISGSAGQIASSRSISTNFILVSGFEISTDTDRDTARDIVDNCPALANFSQADTDLDGHGNDCDTFPVDPTEWLDTDGDGLGNNADLDDDNDSLTDIQELALNTDPLVFDTDGDGFSDGDELIAGTDPLNTADYPVSADGDITLDGIVDIRDILLGMQVLSSQATLSNQQMIHGDVAPLQGGLPGSDGAFTLGDLVVIVRKVQGQISF